MKTINALLLLTLIFAVNSDLSGFDTQKCQDYMPTELGGSKPAYSLDFCRSTNYVDDFYRCCFIKYEQNEKRQYHCAGVTDYGFWNIDDTIDAYQKSLGTDADIDSFDCSASYLYVSLLLIFALLF